MATKEQERKALEQIRKIVDGLGEGSYIGMAFEGCFEDAEENINNDWGVSMKQRYEEAEKDARTHLLRIEEQRALIEEKDGLIEAVSTRLEDSENMYERVRKDRDEWKECYNNAQLEANAASARIDELELEIMKLKAKLYDLIVK